MAATDTCVLRPMNDTTRQLIVHAHVNITLIAASSKYIRA